MPEIVPFAPGNYRFLSHAFQYSGGVAADPGHSIVRARFARPLPLAEGFAAIEAYLAALNRPVGAFCACELRSPKQFSDTGFIAFNRHYVQTLERWGHFRNEVNPVARSNVCPEIDPPAEPSFYAFCYTMPDAVAAGDFVIAGSGEAADGPRPYAERIVRLGDVSAAGMRDKARFVVGAMETRMSALGFNWSTVTATQLYTVHDVYPAMAEEIIRPGTAPGGLTWHYARPPVEGLDLEIDVRGVRRELVI